MPLVTIAVVVRNARANLDVTLQSIAALRDNLHETVVVDGASTDGTLERLNDYRSLITTLYSAPDRGVYFAMNHALSLAQGDYIIYMNSGDWFSSPEVLQRIANNLPSVPPDFILGRYRHHGRRFLQVQRPLDQSLRFSWLRNGRPALSLWRLACHQATLSRTASLRALGGYDTQYRFLADQAVLFRAVQQGLVFQMTSEIICDYAGGGMSAQPDKVNVELRQLLVNFGCPPELAAKAVGPSRRRRLLAELLNRRD